MLTYMLYEQASSFIGFKGGSPAFQDPKKKCRRRPKGPKLSTGAELRKEREAHELAKKLIGMAMATARKELARKRKEELERELIIDEIERTSTARAVQRYEHHGCKYITLSGRRAKSGMHEVRSCGKRGKKARRPHDMPSFAY